MYDLLFEGVEIDARFLTLLATRYGGPILDLGCGTGRLSIPLAKAGLDVLALDSSDEMLGLAASKHRDQKLPVTWRLGDFRKLDLGTSRFGTVLLACDAIGHLRTDEDWRATLGGIRRHLTRTGRLIIAAPNPRPEFLDRPGAIVGLRDTPAGPVLIVEAAQFDALGGLRRLTWLLRGPEGTSRKIVVETSVHSPAALQARLRDAGFAIEAQYGDYDGSPPAPGSPEQILICRPDRA
ncbi:MAG: class I SAM-dependent methyltransferase [Candidatus Sericytochromatia bacterium]|uniref:Class I SAM-dependent methyltransferase n=1 Tax=Candidatus Tanganyikabacteria bacterium TaxID=2961651 RepID=A0A937X1L1_9BACT|nr:class I SAM-dependent methyltransferase [Candidatus Tanganyikabacteria bacterium]